MKSCLFIGENAPNTVIKALSEYRSDIITMPSFHKLPSPVSSHADMLIFPLDGKILIHKDYISGIDVLEKNEIPYILTDEFISNEYPNDILFNCFYFDKYIFGKIESISKKIIEKGKIAVNVKQGYAKCSSIPISSKGIITEDVSICKAAAAIGINTLLIEKESIILNGYNRGFIGGASGMLDENTLFFCGDITKHKSYFQINDFCDKIGVAIKYIPNLPLYDVGSIIKFSF